jgi:hypothetical protein
MSRLKVKAAHVAAMAGLLVAGLGVSAALADPGNGNGHPPLPDKASASTGTADRTASPILNPGTARSVTSTETRAE